VRIQHDHQSWFLPLETDDEETAISNARIRYQTVVSHGWPSVSKRFAYEFTLAVFWLDNPVGCTYTSLFSLPNASGGHAAPLVRPGHETRAVLILESDEQFRLALVQCVNQIRGYFCVAACDSAQEIIEASTLPSVQLVLYNRTGMNATNAEVQRALQKRSNPLSFGYAIYEQSDDIFASLTGVSGGYFLRRRPPSDMLEPLQGVWRSESPREDQARSQIASYFYDLFRHPPAESSDTANLTQREREILRCLCNGCPDKEIARILQIGASTVHTHLKHIFEKLGVHTRTEAVIRYMQK
jgi:DNA-binding NarL/FixJ family response regulator